MGCLRHRVAAKAGSHATSASPSPATASATAATTLATTALTASPLSTGATESGPSSRLRVHLIVT
ncbi:hypothetical protein [Desulfoluna spongiiphila]|uniref:hypothetical protein n=1 Tax=Desulfoluna spongiiphila TaxID=419481 RepID=UPI00158713D2|nr:hypothetical protein [Desulfoluna spongiiphila]